MAKVIIIAGGTGTGKTRSIKGLDPETTAVINVLKLSSYIVKERLLQKLILIHSLISIIPVNYIYLKGVLQFIGLLLSSGGKYCVCLLFTLDEKSGGNGFSTSLYIHFNCVGNYHHAVFYFIDD